MTKYIFVTGGVVGERDHSGFAWTFAEKPRL